MTDKTEHEGSRFGVEGDIVLTKPQADEKKDEKPRAEKPKEEKAHAEKKAAAEKKDDNAAATAHFKKLEKDEVHEPNRFVIEGAAVRPEIVKAENHPSEFHYEDVKVKPEHDSAETTEPEVPVNVTAENAAMNRRRPGNTVDGKPEVLNHLRPGNVPDEQLPVRRANKKGTYIEVKKHDDEDVKGKHYLKDVRLDEDEELR